MARIPYDIHARSFTGIKPIPIERTALPASQAEIETRHNQLISELRRIALANGYGKLVKVFQESITTTAMLLKEHVAKDDRLLDIYNNDVAGGNTLLIDIEPEVTIGRPIKAGESLRLIVVPNDRIYARSLAGTISVRIMEIVIFQSQ